MSDTMVKSVRFVDEKGRVMSREAVEVMTMEEKGKALLKARDLLNLPTHSVSL